MSRLNGFACFVNCVGIIVLAMGAKPAESPEGVSPVGVNGDELNLDFETGTLKDWTAEGDAFKGQPIKGDTVAARRGDMQSQHHGAYWIGGFELAGDAPQGTLTSVPFPVTHAWSSFLIGGGPHKETCVEIVRQDNGQVLHRASGLQEETMRREIVDLTAVMGKQIFIRLVDKHTGDWGHINFDDFRFHSTKPNFPPRGVVSPGASKPDIYKFAGLPPEKSAAEMTVPENFRVTLFAGEPDVAQPVAFCIDDRGRLWVAEAYSYPVKQPEGQGKDRIVIFEDTDGDGKFDKRTVFMEGLNLVSGLEVGFGGVWIGAAPQLLFVPFNERENKPSGPAQILLDGWGLDDTHEVLNTFTWGPDGWLYGCHGVFTHSRVGKPGTPDEQRVPINAGIWRYHPTRHAFEVFAHGTSNPWGLDFDDRGQLFCEACVIPHCYHIIQGGRYQRQAGDHFNIYTYDDIKTIADHLHYVGANPHGGNDRSDGAGGGHAHCGTMIYLGGAWPAEYRDQIFMGNIHGHRINMDILKPKGSGYVASHGADFLLANDAWARFINLQYGPDGNVFLIDWYDKQACHTGDPQVWDRSNGRIYKISYRGSKPAPAGATQLDLKNLSNKELVELTLNPNEWYVRHARRLLQERGADSDTRKALETIALGAQDEARRLRGLWALHVVGGLSPELVQKGLQDRAPYIRAWTIQLALENGKPTPAVLRKMTEMASADESPVVRRYLASALQRLPVESRWQVLEGLVAHAEDGADPNLPLLYWYAAEPLAQIDPTKALDLAVRAKSAPLREFMPRRIGSIGAPETIELLVERLGGADDPAMQHTYIRGLVDGLKGKKQVAMPTGWSKVFDKLISGGDAKLRGEVMNLAVTFGDPAAFAELRRHVADAHSDSTGRQNALAALLAAGDKELAPVLQRLVIDQAMRGTALRGLAAYDESKTPAVILDAFSTFSAAEKRDALSTLAARPAYARAVLDAVERKQLAASDVPVDIVRQMRNLKDTALDERLGEVWGMVRSTPTDRLKQIADLKAEFNSPSGIKPDVELGRAVFSKTCQQCHTLFGIGGKVGPDITGSNRANLDYLLENIVDPSAVIPKEYAASIIGLKDGRVLTGIVRSETPAAFAVVLPNETLTISKEDVDFRKVSKVSMMPEGILQPLKKNEIRGLLAYLQSRTQTPLLATADNARDFFNGKDLSGWNGDLALWKVENGQIVGRSSGIKKNEFLRSQIVASDFRLTLQVKLTPNAENSGIQFRTESLPDGEVRGPQADVGKGWWGKLYEENGRGVLSENKASEAVVKVDDWNRYEIVAQGSHVRTFLNGKSCVDIDDPKGPARGIFALQIHAGGPMEVRFKEIELVVLPAVAAGPSK